MHSKIVIAFLVTFVVCISSENPAANKPWHFIHRRVSVSPNMKEMPFESFLPPKVTKTTMGTKTVAGCGVPAVSNSILPSKDGKIVGGTEVTPHSFPWQAALFINLIWFCGGSLINEEYVLTAGHCLYEMSEANVILGAHNINDAEASQLAIRSTDLTVHENYQPLVIHNDLALIKLPTLVTYNEFIVPICLPALSDPNLDIGTIVTSTGWGLTSDQATTISPVLMAVDVPIYDHDLCNDYYGIVNAGIICIDTAGDHGTCSGDSGGPMNYNPSGSQYITRGIVSFGSTAGCDSDAPDAYTRVEYYLDWISSHTGIAVDA